MHYFYLHKNNELKSTIKFINYAIIVIIISNIIEKYIKNVYKIRFIRNNLIYLYTYN